MEKRKANKAIDLAIKQKVINDRKEIMLSDLTLKITSTFAVSEKVVDNRLKLLSQSYPLLKVQENTIKWMEEEE